MNKWEGSSARFIQTVLSWCIWEEKLSNLERRACEECSGAEESIRQDHEFEAGTQRGNAQCCQCVRPTDLDIS